ncbi:MAG: Arm DNA-binding domain-containing protein [Motiliproteus sp.]
MEKDYKLSDGKGLYLRVKSTGPLYWWFKHRLLDKEKTLVLGGYPEVRLKEAPKSHFTPLYPLKV